MDDSDFQVALVLITFVLFQIEKNVVFSHTQKSQSQNLRLKSKVSVSVSKIDTIIKSLSLSLNF